MPPSARTIAGLSGERYARGVAVLFPIVAGSVLWVICGFVWLARRETVQRTLAIDRLKVLRIRDLSWGDLAAVQGDGVAAGADPLGDEMAWSEVELAREGGGNAVLWRAEAEPRLVVEDPTGDTLTVEMTAAEIQLPWVVVELADDEPNELMTTSLERAGVDVPKPERGARFALRRRGLAPGDPVTVVGVPRLGSDGPVITPRAGICIVTSDSLSTLQEREHADMRALGCMLIGAAVVGVVFLAIGVLAIAFS